MTLLLEDQRQQAKSPSLINVQTSKARQAFCKTVIVLLSRPINAASRVFTNSSFVCLLFVVAVVVAVVVVVVVVFAFFSATYKRHCALKDLIQSFDSDIFFSLLIKTA